MRVAVTGGSGFVGSHVLEKLAQRPEIEVVVACRSSDVLPRSPAMVQLVQFDLASSQEDIYSRLGSPDVLIHLAWSGLPNYKALHHFERQLTEQYRFLSSMIRSGLRSLVCAGTCLEYGLVEGRLHEELIPDPVSAYAIAKDSLRRQLTALRNDTPFAFTWARLFYMYGKGQAPNSLYSQLMSAGQRGDPSYRMSAGEQLRDFLPVTEVADRLVSLALYAPGSGVTNVCSGRPISVRTLVERWIGENGWEMDLELGFYDYVDYEPMAFWGSATRLEEILSGSNRRQPPSEERLY